MTKFKRYLNNFSPTITSRRERMTYWVIAIWLIFGIYCAYKGVLMEAAAYTTPLVAITGWYLQKETDIPSDKPM